MLEKTIATIALDNRDFPSFAAKLEEAVQWIELAAAQGAELAVLPEVINRYCGDGPGNPRKLPAEEEILDDWQRQTEPLFDAARRCGLAVTIPITHTLGDGKYVNCFYLVSREGEILGRYQKLRPTPGALKNGAEPGQVSLIEWDGLKIGGAICFDTHFPWVFDAQARAGADLFLVPSLWPGGDYLSYYALRYSTPIALAYPAWSRIIDIDGREIVAGGYRNETLRFGFGAPVYVATINFDRVALYADHNQQRMVDVQRAYGKKVRVTFQQQNCMFYLESRDPELTVQEVMQRFELIPQRQHLDESEELCRRHGGAGPAATEPAAAAPFQSHT